MEELIFVKVQLYESKLLFNNNDRNYVQLTKKEFFELNDYARQIGINFFASIFDKSKIDWCEEAGIDFYKIASRSIKDKSLCKEIIRLNKKVFISLGMHKNLKSLPYKRKKCYIFLLCFKVPNTTD